MLVQGITLKARVDLMLLCSISPGSSDDSDDDDASKAAQASKYFPFAPPPPLEKSGGVRF